MSVNLAADAHELKSRLQWGQPNFTIIDVRDRPTYNHGHISGAITIPLDDLVTRAKSSLHAERHIYVYGENDEQTAQAAKLLQDSGFAEVAEINGGFAAWKSAGGAIEGLST
ncbi:rhodanese [Nostoc minutum NIES-26]|uniref:Rhodanese n=1 Tax=Nostoc minutum NIES-26 TaxID=1844469 RepID=A0A367Q8K5_9NOSO|nr:rhodanese-like domain-containing protein [Dendronalium sp. ChiSLP03b]MDZ8208834.1 rhodanese-like domain-containing protein [Dendronalium sp. ChiSLP03b]RCJ19452.1 rhodanese [Nostoc minutum NIES-26]